MEIEITPQIQNLVDRISELHRMNLEDSKATGTLQNFQTRIDIDSNHFIVVFELEDYWKYVEYGRGPGKQPPVSSIEQWIKVKPIIPDSRNGKIPTTTQLAYLISRKIGREGTKGQYPLKRTLESIETESLINAIKQEIIRQIRIYITQDEISR